jgi:hypothetical protein
VSAEPSQRRFSEAFVTEMQAQYAGKRSLDRQLTYPIAVDDEYAPWRAWLDEQLQLLPANAADRMVRQLWLDAKFWPCVMELAAGAALRRLGLHIVYEQAWDGLSPDWTAVDEEGKPLFFVEVHTDMPPKETYGRIRTWHQLAWRIEAIPASVALILTNGDRPLYPPGSKAGKRIAQDLERALGGSILPAFIDSQGYRFQIVRSPDGRLMPSSNAPYASFIQPSGLAGAVSARDLSIKVKQKVSKYRVLAEAHDVPLVIAAGASRFTGLEISHVDDLLNGTPTMTFQFNAGDAHIGDSTIDMAHPPHWRMPREMAGLLWMSNEYPFPLAAVRPNLSADKQLPSILSAPAH